MKISNLSLPYPVLGVHDDIAGKYEVTEPTVITGLQETTVSMEHTVRNHEIQSLIKDGRARYITQVHCLKTSFRKCYDSSDAAQRIILRSDDLRGMVELEFYVIATQGIPDYSPRTAHPDYAGVSFNIEKGDVLACGGTAKFVADKQWLSSEAVGSFMEIVPGKDKTGPMKINLLQDKITIQLSRDDFRQYQGLSIARRFDEIFHSALVLPVLIYAITQMCESGDEFTDLKWFQVLSDKRQNDPVLSDMAWSSANAPVIAQMILRDPFDRTLDAMAKIIAGSGTTLD